MKSYHRDSAAGSDNFKRSGNPFFNVFKFAINLDSQRLKNSGGGGAPSAGARFPFNDFGQLSGSGNLFLFSFPFHRRGDFSGRFLLSVILENVSQFGGGKNG